MYVQNHRKSPKITENHRKTPVKSQKITENHRIFIKKDIVFFDILLYNIYGHFIFTITLLMRRTKMEYYLEVEN